MDTLTIKGCFFKGASGVTGGEGVRSEADEATYRQQLKDRADWPNADSSVTNEMLLLAIKNAETREAALRAMQEAA